MMFEDKEDTTLSNYDERDILSNFSSEIAIDTILQQIDLLFNKDEIPKNTSDLFEIVIQKYNFLKNKYSDKEELISNLESIMDEIITDILNKIQENLDFEIFFSESLMFDDKIHYIHMIYSFFINYIEDNIQSLFYNYFINNIKEFPKREINKKDQFYINFKSIIPSEYLNQVYYAVENIESIQNYKFVAEDVIELMIEDEPMNETNYWISNIFIDNLFVDITYGDNFIKNILEIAFRTNKIYKVQNLIINKYKKVED